MTEETNPTVSSRTRQILAIVRRRGWILVLCILIGAAAAYGITSNQQTRYSATAALLFQQDNLSQQLFGYSTTTVTDPVAQAATNINLVEQPVVAVTTARALHLSISSVTSEISVAPAGTSNVVNVTATDGSPTFAAQLANTYARLFISYRQRAQGAQVATAAAQLQNQIQQVRSNGSRPQVRQLQTRLSQLRVLESLQTGDVQLAQSALVPTNPSSPNKPRATLLGLLAGLVVGILAILLLERLDQTLRDPDEVRASVGLPLVGVIPLTRNLSRSSGGHEFGTTDESETFRLLRAQLRYFNIDSVIDTILVSSAGSGDGKSTVAWNLACAAASGSPSSRVLIVDADLRRPSISAIAGINPVPGLSEILTHEVGADEVVRTVELNLGAGQQTKLSVLPSGTVPPNPAELMESQRLRALVEELRANFDFVVFDAPPTSVVSDAIPLMTLVSGVLVVIRLRYTRRPSIQALREQLDGVGAHVLGVVVNGATSAGGYTDYGGYKAYLRDKPVEASSVPD